MSRIGIHESRERFWTDIFLRPEPFIERRIGLDTVKRRLRKRVRRKQKDHCGQQDSCARTQTYDAQRKRYLGLRREGGLGGAARA